MVSFLRLRRSTTILLALTLSVVTFVLLANPLSPSAAISLSVQSTGAGPRYPLCSNQTSANVTWPLQSWRAAAESKYGGLLEDKFT